MKPVARVVDINTIKIEPGTVLQEGAELFTAAQVEELLQPAEPGDFEIIPTEMTAEYLRRDRFAGEALQGLLAGMGSSEFAFNEDLAERAVALADALIQELDKGKEIS